MNEIVKTNTSFDVVCESFLPIPKDTVLIGVAQDEAPVLVSTNPTDYKNVFVNEQYIRQGLPVLKTAVEFILKHKTGRPLDVVVLSNNDWAPISGTMRNGCECVSISRFDSPISEDVLEALAMWAGKPSRPVILFIDGLSEIGYMSENAKFCLNKILCSGSNHSVYVFATSGVGDVSNWSLLFDVEIRCRIDDLFEYEEHVNNEVFTTKFRTLEPTI